MNPIKRYFFWRKYRWYRKDEVMQALISHRFHYRRLAFDGLLLVDKLVEYEEERKMIVKDNAQLEVKLSLMKGRVIYALKQIEVLENILLYLKKSIPMPEELQGFMQRAIKNAEGRIER